MKKIKAAIIDDGVYAHFDFVTQCWKIDKNGKTQRIQPNLEPYDTNQNDSHGDTCMRIIQKYIPKDIAEFYSIQILDRDTRKGDVNSLVRALELCLNLNVQFVHMSIGSSSYQDFHAISETIQKLADRNITIVAATSNRGNITYPAYLQNVISVKSNAILKDNQYYYRRNVFDRIDFESSSAHLIKKDGQFRVTSNSNSYAAPLISAYALSIIHKFPGITSERVKEKLVKYALNYDAEPYYNIPQYFRSNLKTSYILNAAESCFITSYAFSLCNGNYRLTPLKVKLSEIGMDDSVIINLPEPSPWADEDLLHEKKRFDGYTFF